MATKKKAPSEREITDPIARELAIRWLCIRRGKDRAAAAEELDWLAKRGGDAEVSAMIDRMSKMALGLGELVTREAFSTPGKSVISKEWTLVERLWVISATMLGVVRYLAMGGVVGTDASSMDMILLIAGGSTEQMEAARSHLELLVQMAGDEGFPGRGGEALRLHYIIACATLTRDHLRAGGAYGAPGIPTMDTFLMLASGTLKQVNAARAELDTYVDRARAEPPPLPSRPDASVFSNFASPVVADRPANDAAEPAVSLPQFDVQGLGGTASGPEPMTSRSCGHSGPGSYCQTLANRLNPQANHGKGFAETIITKLDTGEQRIIGVAYRTQAKDNGVMLNVCPFCGASIAWFDVAPPSPPTTSGDVKGKPS